ncbi:MAG: HEAT repeat domain-containing protein [Chloroflexota bacterium]
MVDFDPRIFKSLRSSDPEERKKGVRALAQTGEREAFRYLATVYKQDPDPEVRQLALDAGKHVKKMLIQSDWVGEGIKNPTQEMKAIPSGVPEADQKQSKKMMDDALELVVNEQYEKAEALAVKAFAINPDLDQDPYYRGLASEIMGMPESQAIDELMARIDTQNQ